jgi:hypothetical protein
VGQARSLRRPRRPPSAPARVLSTPRGGRRPWPFTSRAKQTSPRFQPHTRVACNSPKSVRLTYKRKEGALARPQTNMTATDTSTPAAAKISGHRTQSAMTAHSAPNPESHLRANLELNPVTCSKHNEFYLELPGVVSLGRFCPRSHMAQPCTIMPDRSSNCGLPGHRTKPDPRRANPASRRRGPSNQCEAANLFQQRALAFSAPAHASAFPVPPEPHGLGGRRARARVPETAKLLAVRGFLEPIAHAAPIRPFVTLPNSIELTA